MHTFLLFVSCLIISFSQLAYAMDNIKPSQPSKSRRVLDPNRPSRDVLSTLSGSSGSETPSTSTDRLSSPKNWFSASSSSLSQSSPRSPQASPRGKTQKKNPEDKIYNNLLRAVRKGNRDFVEKCLQNLPESEINLNQKIESMGNNTLVHLAVLRRNKDIVNMFIERADISFLIPNGDGRPACDLFSGGSDIQNYKQLYEAVTARTDLDRVIRAMMLLYDKIFMFPDISDDLMRSTIDAVRKNFPAEFFQNYATRHFIVRMVHALRKRDLFTMQLFLDSRAGDANLCDEFGNRLLDYAAYLQDPEHITQLVKNPRITGCSRNSAGKLPHQLIRTNSDLSRFLFSRDCLERIVRQETEIFLIKNPETIQCSVQDPSIKICIDNITNEYKKMFAAQAEAEDRNLPEECALPQYATTPFNAEMLKNCLQEARKRKETIEQEKYQLLDSLVKKETDAFLFERPVTKELSLKDPAVQTSVTHIKDEYKRMRPEFNLPEYIIDRVICAMLEHYALQKKPNLRVAFIKQEQTIEPAIETKTIDPEQSQYL